MGYDFVVDPGSGQRLILEMSYVFNASVVHNCPGSFDPDLVWSRGQVWPQDAILGDLLSTLVVH